MADTIQSMTNTDLVRQAQGLLEATIKSTDILNLEEMTLDDVRKAKVVLGFLNATNNLMQTKLKIFQMTNVGDKIRAIEEQTRRKSGEGLE